MKKITIILFFVFSISSIFSQSVLWKLSGKNLKKPSYLYGTIHIQDKRVFDYNKIVEEKILECDAYAMEVLLDEIDKESLQKAMIMQKQTLDNLLNKEDFAKLEKLLKEKTGMSILFFNKTKPFFIMSQIMQADMNKDMALALDMHFLDIARKNGKLTLGIEKFEDQMAAVDQITLQEQAKMLIESLNDTLKENTKFDELLETYLKADLNKMLELSADSSMPPKFNQAFLIDRNINMAKNIAKFSKKQATFNAIGAAHLAGKDGVISLLRKRGYTVDPIIFKSNSN